MLLTNFERLAQDTRSLTSPLMELIMKMFIYHKVVNTKKKQYY